MPCTNKKGDRMRKGYYRAELNIPSEYIDSLILIPSEKIGVPMEFVKRMHGGGI